MGKMFSELWDYVGSINEDGYIFDSSNHCTAKITDTGYITSLSTFDTYGKIDEDGTIRDSSGDVVGRIQADGYVYIHSKRVGKISSTFIEKITPKAWNAGQTSTYSGRTSSTNDTDSDYSDTNHHSFFSSKFFIILVLGIILGIVGMASGWGGFEMIFTGPIVVFLIYVIYKIFNH